MPPPSDIQIDQSEPLLVVVMGVCGSGKSTLGAMIAETESCDFIDSDRLHPPANIAKMASGVALDDEDRRPWLDAVGATLAAATGGGRVVACSALKRAYRQRITAAAGRPVLFVHLAGSEAVLSARMAARRDHFMPPALLRSQLDTLETPCSDEFAVVLDGDQPIDAVLDHARACIRAARHAHA